MNSNGTGPPDPGLPVARSSRPRVDDSLPVRQTSLWLFYLVMTGGWSCALASVAVTVYNDFFHYLATWVACIVAAVSFGAAYAVGSTLAKLKPDERLGPVSRRFAVAAVVVGVASAVLMLLSHGGPNAG